VCGFDVASAVKTSTCGNPLAMTWHQYRQNASLAEFEPACGIGGAIAHHGSTSISQSRRIQSRRQRRPDSAIRCCVWTLSCDQI